MDKITPIISMFLKIELIIFFVFAITSIPEIKKDGGLATISNSKNLEWLVTMTVLALIMSMVFGHG